MDETYHGVLSPAFHGEAKEELKINTNPSLSLSMRDKHTETRRREIKNNTKIPSSTPLIFTTIHSPQQCHYFHKTPTSSE